MQRNVYLCLKAFDKVQHKGIIQALNKQNLGKEYVQLIKNFNWNQKKEVQIGNKTTFLKKYEEE